MSKAELARKAGVSPLTIDGIEKGNSCRLSECLDLARESGIRIFDTTFFAVGALITIGKGDHETSF